MNYGRLAGIYDFLDMLHYNRVCHRSRNCFLGTYDLSFSNALFVACGTGDFAGTFVESENPSRIVLNDSSQEMLAVAQKRIRATGWKGACETIEAPIESMDALGPFSFISTNYFLSMFSSAHRAQLLCKIGSLLAPDGILQVSDFARPEGMASRFFAHVNWWIGNVFFWLVSGTKPNTLGNMEEDFARANLVIVRKKAFVGGLYATYLLKKRN